MNHRPKVDNVDEDYSGGYYGSYAAGYYGGTESPGTTQRADHTPLMFSGSKVVHKRKDDQEVYSLVMSILGGV